MIVKNYLNTKIPTSLALLIILLLSVLVGRFAWQNYMDDNAERIGASQVKILEKKGGLSLTKLKNAEYETCWNPGIGKVKFTNGTFSQPSQLSNEGWSVSIVEDKIASGDLNNDGKEDDALILVGSAGGNENFYELVVVLNYNGEPVYAGCHKLGDRVKINSVDIKSGEIIVDLFIHAENDSLCCPTIRETFKYQISGNKLIKMIEI